MEITRLSGYKRIIAGIIILLLVDVIWVVSAELSEYIFHNANFNKPFFTTYFKSSMFTLYLFGFFFVRRWQFQCADLIKKNDSKKLFKEVKRVSKQAKKTTNQNLSVVSDDVSRASTPVSYCHFSSERYEKMTDDDLSIDEIENSVSNQRVSFSNTREVRSLSESHHEAQTLARMSQNSFESLKTLLFEVHDKYPLPDTLKLSLYVSVLWMLATLFYQEALSDTSAAVTNILSTCSAIFTLILAAIFPSSPTDKFTISKFLAVLVSFGGIFLICWTDPSRGETKFNFGELFSLLGAILYASYLILIKRKVKDDENLDIPLFFGFLGLFSLLIFWPGFFILHYTKQEIFELPPDKKTWMYLAINAVVGTVVSEFLWLWGCFLTSSLMATLSLGLVIPLSMLWDMFFNNIKFSWLFFVGIIPVLFSFIAVTVLTHKTEWDPVKDCLKFLFCRRKASNIEENKSLLDDDEENSNSGNSLNHSINSITSDT